MKTNSGNRQPDCVLVVDDDESMRRLYRHFLASPSVRVLEAVDGAGALEAISRQRPDLVLLDVNMPGMDGFGVIQALRDNRATRELPVLMLSGEDDIDTVTRAYEAGITDFIAKPANFSVLKARVRHLIKQARTGQAAPAAGPAANGPAGKARPAASTIDPLTGLYNRAGTMQHLSRLINLARLKGRNIAVICIGLNRFELVNAAIGHEQGDKLLIHTADRLAACLGGAAVAGRLGGDEFLVMVPNLPDRKHTDLQLARLSRCLADGFDIDGKRISISAGIGISLFPEHGNAADTLMRNASAAMGVSKASPAAKPRYFRLSMASTAMQKLTIESELWEALEQGQMRLHYQPQFSIGSGKLYGVEALLRWQHPQLGLLPPARFLPALEGSSLMPLLGEWVLNTACRQASRWRREWSMPLKMAVNISPHHLCIEDFIGQVQNALQTSRLQAGDLTLEITETVMIRDMIQARSVLDGLGKLGVRISIDDFGTGYSSLKYLKHLPFDELKIDRYFVADILDNPRNTDLVSSIIEISRALNSEVVAEGIETRAQYRLLHELGCQRAQGFLLARPSSPEDFQVRYVRPLTGIDDAGGVPWSTEL